jgi:hypothetical protein
LQASRRLDWRFLLPDPSLGRVAYVGAAQPDLVDALTLFAAQVDCWPTPGTDAQDGHDRYDHVVAHAPTGAALQQAVARLRPGGWLYVEARGPLASKRRTPVLPRYAAALRRLGLDAIQAFWIWPDFATCTKIIPVAHLATVAQFQLKLLRPAPLNRFVRGQIVPRLAGSRLAHAAIPCFGIVAQSPAKVV